MFATAYALIKKFVNSDFDTPLDVLLTNKLDTLITAVNSTLNLDTIVSDILTTLNTKETSANAKTRYTQLSNILNSKGVSTKIAGNMITLGSTSETISGCVDDDSEDYFQVKTIFSSIAPVTGIYVVTLTGTTDLATGIVYKLSKISQGGGASGMADTGGVRVAAGYIYAKGATSYKVEIKGSLRRGNARQIGDFNTGEQTTFYFFALRGEPIVLFGNADGTYDTTVTYSAT